MRSRTSSRLGSISLLLLVIASPCAAFAQAPSDQSPPNAAALIADLECNVRESLRQSAGQRLSMPFRQDPQPFVAALLAKPGNPDPCAALAIWNALIETKVTVSESSLADLLRRTCVREGGPGCNLPDWKLSNYLAIYKPTDELRKLLFHGDLPTGGARVVPAEGTYAYMRADYLPRFSTPELNRLFGCRVEDPQFAKTYEIDFMGRVALDLVERWDIVQPEMLTPLVMAVFRCEIYPHDNYDARYLRLLHRLRRVASPDIAMALGLATFHTRWAYGGTMHPKAWTLYRAKLHAALAAQKQEAVGLLVWLARVKPYWSSALEAPERSAWRFHVDPDGETEVFLALTDWLPRSGPSRELFLRTLREPLKAIGATGERHFQDLVMGIMCRLGESAEIGVASQLLRTAGALSRGVICASEADRGDLLAGLDRDLAGFRGAALTRYVQFLARKAKEGASSERDLLASVIVRALGLNTFETDGLVITVAGFDRALAEALDVLRTTGYQKPIPGLEQALQRLLYQNDRGLRLYGDGCWLSPWKFPSVVRYLGSTGQDIQWLEKAREAACGEEGYVPIDDAVKEFCRRKFPGSDRLAAGIALKEADRIENIENAIECRGFDQVGTVLSALRAAKWEKAKMRILDQLNRLVRGDVANKRDLLRVATRDEIVSALGGEAESTVMEMLRSKERNDRLAGITAAGALRLEKARVLLVKQAASSDPELKAQARSALISLPVSGGEAAPANKKSEAGGRSRKR